MRIGLVGYSARTGLGELNRQIVKYCNIHRWLIKPHKKGVIEPQDVNYLIGNSNYEIEKFLQTVDVILFCETPYYEHLVQRARELGKRIVCVPMQEWLPTNREWWVKHVDLFICPTVHCYEELNGSLPCVCFPWPIDIERYTFTKRTKCDNFLFLNGNGGWSGRKGASTVAAMIRSWRDIPLVVKSQVQVPPELQNKMISGELIENTGLYDQGDVLICPHTVDGLGLELQEAAACGIPVISTEGRPWDEYPYIEQIKSTKTRMMVNREVDWYLPSAQDLLIVCKRVLNSDISTYSEQARQWAETRDWKFFKDQFTELVLRGKRTVELGMEMVSV